MKEEGSGDECVHDRCTNQVGMGKGNLLDDEEIWRGKEKYVLCEEGEDHLFNELVTENPPFFRLKSTRNLLQFLGIIGLCAEECKNY